MTDEQPQYPAPPPVTVHFVIGASRAHEVRSTLDEAEAHRVARENGGLVVSMPASGDYRPSRPPCPTCGAPVNIERIDVTAATDQVKVYVPGGETRCTADRTHEVAEVASAWLRGGRRS